VSAKVGSQSRHGHRVAQTGLDVLAASGTDVTLERLKRVHPANVEVFEVVVVVHNSAHARPAQVTANAAKTNTTSDRRRRCERVALNPMTRSWHEFERALVPPTP